MSSSIPGDVIKEEVKNYYGKTLQTSADLQTNACCASEEIPDYIKAALAQIHDEVMAKYYGCGLTIPEALKGLKILDLGSGSGRDCFLASQLVGEDGHVIGLDMTEEQLAVANKHIQYHTKKYGYSKPNVEFIKGHLEELEKTNIEPSSLDLIISNCVINLSTNKKKVLKDCFALLKDGGEMYFSDVYVNKRIPKDLAQDPVIYGECLGGALYWNDFTNFAKEAGFIDPRIVEAAPISIENFKIQKALEGFEFYSVTYRLFKMSDLEQDCEDYGQAVLYKGGIETSPYAFTLDRGHVFPAGKAVSVCGNTYLMLKNSRHQEYFEFIGNFHRHFGIFPDCGKPNPFGDLHSKSSDSVAGSCC